MFTFFLVFTFLTMLYFTCAFINPYYAANLHRTHGIEVPVFKFCMLGFIGTFVITLIYLMNMEANNDNDNPFVIKYRRYLRKLNG